MLRSESVKTSGFRAGHCSIFCVFQSCEKEQTEREREREKGSSLLLIQKRPPLLLAFVRLNRQENTCPVFVCPYHYYSASFGVYKR